jgi:hypothetical protein
MMLRKSAELPRDQASLADDVSCSPQWKPTTGRRWRELRQKRRQDIDVARAGLKLGVAEGELLADVNCRAVATHYATVQHGVSMATRDGASRKDLLAVVDCAMAAWGGLTSSRGDQEEPL